MAHAFIAGPFVIIVLIFLTCFSQLSTHTQTHHSTLTRTRTHIKRERERERCCGTAVGDTERPSSELGENGEGEVGLTIEPLVGVSERRRPADLPPSISIGCVVAGVATGCCALARASAAVRNDDADGDGDGVVAGDTAGAWSRFSAQPNKSIKKHNILI
jgi:hypothetical protein